MTLEADLRELIREAVRRGLREELPTILGEHLKPLADAQQRASDPGPVLSTSAAARYADVSPATIRAWVSAGQLRARRAGRVLKVRRADLDAFLARSEPRGEGIIDLSEHAREILSGRKPSRE